MRGLQAPLTDLAVAAQHPGYMVEIEATIRRSFW
jgi:hypothetical protein